MTSSYRYDGAKCSVKDCKTWTGHSTGICTAHRERKCDICGVSFVYQNASQKRCGPHRGIVDKEAYLTRKNNAVKHYGDIRYPRSMT